MKKALPTTKKNEQNLSIPFLTAKPLLDLDPLLYKSSSNAPRITVDSRKPRGQHELDSRPSHTPGPVGGWFQYFACNNIRFLGLE